MEGSFEYTGYYGEARNNPVFEISLITHWKNPIFLGAWERWYLSGSAMAVGKASRAEAYKTLKKLVPGLLDLWCDVTYNI